MFVCGLEVGRKWVRVVWTSDYPGGAPEFMETRRFLRPVEPHQVLAQIDAWSGHYGCRPEAIVCSATDPMPQYLKRALQSGQDRLEWVSGLELQKGLAVWLSSETDQQWLRAGLMGFLFSTPLACRSGTDIPWRAAWGWRYAQLRRMVLEVEALLLSDGRIFCPGQLGPLCPECQGSWSQEMSWVDVPF